MIDPWYAPSIAKDICFPDTTKEDDAYKGKWVRVAPSLSAQTSWQSLVRFEVFSAIVEVLHILRTFTIVGRVDMISRL